MPRPRKVAIPEEKPEKGALKTTVSATKTQSKATKGKSNNAPNAAKKVKIDYELAISHDGKSLAQIILNLQKNSSNTSKTITDLKKVYDKVRNFGNCRFSICERFSILLFIAYLDDTLGIFRCIQKSYQGISHRS